MGLIDSVYASPVEAGPFLGDEPERYCLASGATQGLLLGLPSGITTPVDSYKTPRIVAKLSGLCQAFFHPAGALSSAVPATERTGIAQAGDITARLAGRCRGQRRSMKGVIRTQKLAILTSSRERIREAARALFAEQGYEAATTAAICRLAGTSQSQIIKHFTDKQGLLEAIFEHAWEQINPAVRLAVEKIPSSTDKLKIMIDMVLSFLEKDRELRTLFLLEGRRIRDDGHRIVFVPGFLDFVKTLDGILKDMAAKGELSPQIHPQALRSALMGAFEGLLRDQMLARTCRFPASYSEADTRATIFHFLSSCLNK